MRAFVRHGTRAVRASVPPSDQHRSCTDQHGKQHTSCSLPACIRHSERDSGAVHACEPLGRKTTLLGTGHFHRLGGVRGSSNLASLASGLAFLLGLQPLPNGGGVIQRTIARTAAANVVVRRLVHSASFKNQEEGQPEGPGTRLGTGNFHATRRKLNRSCCLLNRPRNVLPLRLNVSDRPLLDTSAETRVPMNVLMAVRLSCLPT